MFRFTMKIETYAEVIEALDASEAGRSLRNIYRWSTFRQGESDELWREALGITAVDFSHGQLMYEIGRSFLRLEMERFSPEKERLFLSGILCHDWGEAILNGRGVGDVSAQIKTRKVEVEESLIARQVIASLSLPASVKGELLDGYEQVVEGGDEELYEAFRALEKMEYVMTAMKVYQFCRRQKARNIAGIASEVPLIGRVLVIDLSKILDVYVPKFPNSIGRFFRNQSGLIDDMFKFCYPWLAETKEWYGKPIDHAQLAMNFSAKWAVFKETAL